MTLIPTSGDAGAGVSVRSGGTVVSTLTTSPRGTSRRPSKVVSITTFSASWETTFPSYEEPPRTVTTSASAGARGADETKAAATSTAPRHERGRRRGVTGRSIAPEGRGGPASGAAGARGGPG